jgi:protein FAM32A
MSFVGGKLKLKGGEGLKTTGAVKKKKKKAAASDALVTQGSDTVDPSSAAADTTSSKAALEGYALPPPKPDEDRRTEAQKRHDERVRMLEEERLRKGAAKGYRDRVKDFNEHLASLSEHHDIPKVGPG